MSTFFQTTFRSNFIAGFDKYVERGAFGDPVPDVYWDPKDGRWETYLPSQWRIVDQNLPSVGKIDFLTNAGAVFDQITQQWAGLSPEHRQSAAWDGGRHKWVLAEFINRTGQSCREAYEKQLRYLRGLHTEGLLKDEQFNKQAQDLWERYRHCL